jgi:hypothetical protein
MEREAALALPTDCGVLRGLRPSAFRVHEPTVPPEQSIDRMESLEEISRWLGTFSERLRIARAHEREQIAGVVKKLEAHYKRRRSELA